MNDLWWSCDGGQPPSAENAAEAPLIHTPTQPNTSTPKATRRQVLLSAALGAVVWTKGQGSALADVAVTPHGQPVDRDVLVVIFMRGGADGLNIVVPYAEDAYHRARPTLGLAVPKDRGKDALSRTLDLDGFFGLHPALAPLHPLYHSGQLAIAHACGSGDQSRSHFEAMTTMERGLPNGNVGAASGWLARHLTSTPVENSSPLRAVALSNTVPDSLKGATDATAMTSLDEFRLLTPEGERGGASLRRALTDFYGSGEDAVAQAGRETLTALDTLNRMDPLHYRPSNGAAYPEGPLGNGLRQVACLIKGRVGLEIACLDRGGWDTHVAQGTSGGWLAMLLDDLGKSLAAFAKDMGRGMTRVTVVAMTEFGRRVQENSGLGTDHGRGSVMFLMGGGIHGGRVITRWPGLERAQLEPPGDLRVTTDYRDVLGELLVKRFGNPHLEAVFPNFTPRFPGVSST